MLQEFKSHIGSEFPFFEGKKLLIAISGGIDSVVLTYLLHHLKYDVSLAHCNFQLREKESDLDEVFVKELANDLSIKVFTKKFKTKEFSVENKLSTQVAARNLRYNYFDKLIKKHDFNYVLTAHHADDNLETFLINLTRGTGLEGLTGIPVQNKNIVRPLLEFSRLKIVEYANDNKIKWREDKSNSKNIYVRNKIRHQVIPVLKEINPNLLSSFNKTSKYLQENSIIVNDRITELSNKIIKIEEKTIKLDISKILKLSNSKAYLYQFLKKYNFNEWDKINNLLTAQSGKYILTNKHILFKDRDFLVLSLLENDVFETDKKYYIHEKSDNKIDFPIKITGLNNEKIKVGSKKTILVDKNLVIYPLVIRKKREGDYFYPSGMLGKKKISKFFKDEKLSLIEKHNTWLLTDKNDNVIWVIGLRPDRRFEINKKTKNVLKISI